MGLHGFSSKVNFAGLWKQGLCQALVVRNLQVVRQKISSGFQKNRQKGRARQEKTADRTYKFWKGKQLN